jgi:CRISPR-associated endonuclease/helicase Cas3
MPVEIVALATTSFDELSDDLNIHIRHALSAVTTIADDRQASDHGPIKSGLFVPVPVTTVVSPWRHIVNSLAAERRLRIAPHPSGVGLVVSGRRRLADSSTDFSDDDSISFTARHPVGLLPHLEEVERLVRQFGDAVKLPPDVVADLALAGRCHDLGKADPRFQTWLAGGNRLAALRDGLLAKSAELPSTGTALTVARRRSGYPEGGRHELLSVRLLESCGELLSEAVDPDLVRHLIESHHGRCRPFAPVVIDDHPVTVTLNLNEQITLKTGSATGLERLASGVAERFWRLVRRYGWWGLSYLEACLRLADHWASEQAEAGGNAD